MNLSPLQKARYEYVPKLPGMLRAGISEICVKDGEATASVADQGKEVLAAEIVDPGQGSFGRGDDILPRFVVKMAEFHSFPPLKHRNETGRRKRFS